MKHATGILQAIGLEEADIKTILETPDDKTDFDSAPFLEKITTATTTKVLADPKTYEGLTPEKLPEATRKTIESGQYARFINELAEVATKELGLKEGEDFTPEDKTKLKSFAKKVASVYAGKTAGSADLKKLQQDLLDATEGLNKKDEEWKKKYDDDIDTTKKAGESKLVKLAFTREVADLPGLLVKPSLISDALFVAVSKAYTVAMDPDTLEFKVTQKDNPTLDAIHEGKKLDFKGALALVAKGEKLLDDKKTTPPPPPRTVTVDGSDTPIASYIQEKIDKGV